MNICLQNNNNSHKIYRIEPLLSAKEASRHMQNVVMLISGYNKTSPWHQTGNFLENSLIFVKFC